MSQNVKKCQNLEFGDYIWNHYEKSIQISTNMPDIDFEICEILDFVLMVKPMALYYGKY